MKKVIAEALPELAEFDFVESRVRNIPCSFLPALTSGSVFDKKLKKALTMEWQQLCWYTDSIDNEVQ